MHRFFPRRRRPPATLVLLLFLISVYQLRWIPAGHGFPAHVWPLTHAEGSRPGPEREPLRFNSQQNLLRLLTKPQTLTDTSVHPVDAISKNARQRFDKLLARQSKTLEQAVEEYRRRYKLPPPPHFDKWFAFARENNVQLVDEFDTIHDLITPFWGLQPKTIRSRAREALGHDNGLIGIAIRNHKVAFIDNPRGGEWQHVATTQMIDKFIQFLPDMDLAFNIHDEPRVVLQHDDLARLVQKAKQGDMSNAFSNPRPVNKFATTVPDLGVARFQETRQTRFRSAAHQPTWTTSRMSCPPDSAARKLEDEELGDDAEKFAITDVGFVHNLTAMMDICLSPSLKNTFGLFDLPNGYFVAHDLFPIFSQSKVSSYSDIIYPSPWYWSDKVAYNETKDPSWSDKKGQLYWRGSTTGGFSRDGNWRHQHRQYLVQKMNYDPQAKIFLNGGDAAKPNWGARQVNRSELDPLVNVRFSHVGQCTPEDCESQIKYFGVKNMVDMQDAWGYKFLLDMDGNAFSGRFYAFLRSRSQVFKQALFQEWHKDWLRPWVHYVPISMRGDDWSELVRYYSSRDEESAAMAKASTEWAHKVVRKVDLEAWFFRLLLEYARVVDDDRTVIGFSSPRSGTKTP